MQKQFSTASYRLGFVFLVTCLASANFSGDTVADTTKLAAAAAQGQDNPATADPFEKRDLDGWTVQVDKELLGGNGKEIGDKALRLLANKLFEVKLLLPADRISKLQSVVIFLELKNPTLKSMQYHPSPAWLKKHGHDPRLARAVHIPNATQFVSPQHHHTQPWAVLHELAHAYHDQVLGFNNAKVKEAYARYLELSPKVDVLHISGTMRPHYARTNAQEFFAEFTEAYLGTNDFYPFVAGELKKEFPHIYDLMRDIWGPLP